MNTEKNILWVDDEIDLLKPYLLLLEQKGFNVDTVTNGEDALELVKKKLYGLVFLDEMMIGIDGLQTLSHIKEINPALPVIMVTKNEAESLMEEAIGSKIYDYLVKPVNPTQILLACKKVFDSKELSEQYISRDYLKEFKSINELIDNDISLHEWIDVYTKITKWDIELDKYNDLGLSQMLAEQKRECNYRFSKFVEQNYTNWIEQEKPIITLSNKVVDNFVLPEIDSGHSILFFVIDCMRLDQWLIMEDLLSEYFLIQKKYYLSILPTATPYSRNSIFSGYFPAEIAKMFPSMWSDEDSEDDNSRNKFENELLNKLLERRRIKIDAKYYKILDIDYGKKIEENILDIANNKFASIVVNFIDMLAHGRSDSALLKEIAPNESAYRSLTKSWFSHSSLFGMLKKLATKKNIKIIITTDHGSIRCMRGAKVIGDKETTTNLRYKFGRNLKVDDKQAIIIKNPMLYKLSASSVTTNFISAKEDFFFVYTADYSKYLNRYKDSFQHGGISTEEMILPVVTLTPKI